MKNTGNANRIVSTNGTFKALRSDCKSDTGQSTPFQTAGWDKGPFVVFP
jgi:hypothetical protein